MGNCSLYYIHASFSGTKLDLLVEGLSRVEADFEALSQKSETVQNLNPLVSNQALVCANSLVKNIYIHINVHLILIHSPINKYTYSNYAYNSPVADNFILYLTTCLMFFCLII